MEEPTLCELAEGRSEASGNIPPEKKTPYLKAHQHKPDWWPGTDSIYLAT